MCFTLKRHVFHPFCPKEIQYFYLGRNALLATHLVLTVYYLKLMSAVGIKLLGNLHRLSASK